jgi:hypothetical protein
MVETKETKKELPKEEFEIVAELPHQPIRSFEDDTGKTITVYTVTEALKEMLVILRKLDKAF